MPRNHMRISKSRYRQQFCTLRREIACNIAKSVTLKNCHRHLFKKPKTAPPAMIEGHSRSAQPSIWREHFRNVFESDESLYQGDLFCDITKQIADEDISSFQNIDLK